jgi:diguanylate cyclase (GGDEF)-like protein/PAS domain S-box-containing protein
MTDDGLRNLLLVEDHDPDALYLQQLLEERPPAPNLVRARRLQEALVLVEEAEVEVVLLDLHLPDSRGLDTLRRFLRRVPDLPVVILSGQSDVTTAAAAVGSGAQDYLVKGRIDAELLDRALRHAHSRHGLSRRLRTSEERYHLALEGSHDGIWDWDLLTDELFVSARWREMLGFGAEDAFVRPEDWFSLVMPEDLRRLRTALNDHRRGVTPFLEVEHRVRTKQGRVRWVLTRGAAVSDDEGRVRRLAGSQTDITRYKEAEARLRYDAYHDRLTGLPNRALLLDRLQQAIRRRLRLPSRGFALLFIDLDHFKMVNDSMGHAVGDRFLCAFTERIRPLLRPSDTFARLGGDEFCILLEETSGGEDGERVAGRVQQALVNPLVVDSQPLFASASIGITDSSTAYTRPEDILRDADIAMYRAKARRRGGVGRMDAHEHSALVERFEISTELRYALERDQLELHYQPIVDVQTGDLDGFEALLRWRSPSRGLVGPDTFIPIADETGILPGLGRWAIRSAAKALSDMTETGDLTLDTSVSVNLTPREFLEPDFVEFLTEIFGETGLDPKRMVLEVTENVLMEQSAAATSTFEALKRMGVSIDLDDFGTGFSSLSHLRYFPVDRLKIDRSFVCSMHSNKEDREIVRAIVALGRTLGKRVVAEGIETQQQLESLAALGCDFGQGFLFAAPGRMWPFAERRAVVS